MDREIIRSDDVEDPYTEVEIVNLYRSFEHHLISRGFQYMGRGSFRRVYYRGNIVIKIPVNMDGIIDNRVEDAVWHLYKSKPAENNIVSAPCRLLSNGCLMMGKVNPNNLIPEYPDWACNVDCSQVGVWRNRWVAYDYALEMVDLRKKLEKMWGTRSTFFHDEYMGGQGTPQEEEYEYGQQETI